MAYLITNLKNKAKQQFRVQIPDKDVAEFNFYFMPSQNGWYFDVKYGTFESKGLHLVNSYNVLSAYFNILRFGLSCQVIDGSEPYFVDDFVTGRVGLYILSEDEVKMMESVINA